MTDHFIYFFVGCNNYSTNFVIPFTLNLLHHPTFTPEPKYNYKQAYQELRKNRKIKQKKDFCLMELFKIVLDSRFDRKEKNRVKKILFKFVELTIFKF